MIFSWYSVGHLVLWFVVGLWLLDNWYLFIALSVAWELFEHSVKYKWAWANEPLENKISDIVVNIIGFWLGNLLSSHLNKPERSAKPKENTNANLPRDRQMSMRF